MTRVSVIIPAYNAERYIAETLASVQAQTAGDFEVLLVDDGSRDGTLSVAERFRETMNLRILEQANAGPAAARNLGVRHASGEYCAFLDSDDLMQPDRLATQVERLDAASEVCLVHTDLETFDETGTVHRTRRAFSNPCGGHVLDRLLLENFITTSTVMARRERLLEAGLFNERRRLSEDYELWLKMAQRWPIDYIERALTRYRYSPGSLSHDKFATGRSAMEVVAEFWDRNAAVTRAARRLRRHSLAHHRVFTGISALAAGRRGTALVCLMRAISDEPSNRTAWKALVKAALWPARPVLRTRRRVGLIGSYPPPHGGQSVHIESLKRHLLERGLDVVVLNTGVNKEVNGGDVVSVNSARGLFAALRRHRPFDVLHVHVTDQSDYGKLVPVALAARLSSTPWIATIHSGNSTSRAIASPRLKRAVSSAVLRGAFRLIAVNTAIERHLNALTGADTAVTIVPFSLRSAQAPLPATLERFLDGHDPVLVCTGTYEPVYGFDQAVRLVEAIRRGRPRAGLLLIGDTTRAQWCERLIRDLGLEDHVLLCGDLDHAACLTAIGRGSVFLRPTAYDGDSLSVREALALGVPVVATPTDFRPDGVILYRREDERDLERKVSSILADPGSSRETPDGERNLERVHDLYLQAMQ